MRQLSKLFVGARYELAALAVAALVAALHVWSDGAQVASAGAGPVRPSEILLRAVGSAEGKAEDLQFLMRGAAPPDARVRVVAIDEKSIQRYGRWPWPRNLQARALRRVVELHPAAVGLDITFTDEAEAGPWATVLQSLDAASAGLPEAARSSLASVRATLRARAAEDPDAQLQAALAAPEVVQGVQGYKAEDAADFADRAAVDRATLSPKMLTEFPRAKGRGGYEVNLTQWLADRYRSAQAPLPRFVTPETRLGHFNVRLDADGVLRRTPLFIQLDAPPGLLPSLELQTAAVALGAVVEPAWEPLPLERVVGARLRRGQAMLREVPNELHEPFARIPWPGPQSSVPTVSMADVLAGAPEAAELAGKVVLVGVTLVGSFDQVVTPFKEVEPGVYAHAAMLSAILSNRYLQRGLWLVYLEVAFLLAGALLLARMLPRVAAGWRVALPLGLVAGWCLLGQLLLRHGIQLALVLPGLGLLLVASTLTLVGWLSTDREKLKLRRTFRYYLSEPVMTEMLEHPDHLKLGGEKRELTVLFSDIRGFTSIAERTAPEALVRFVNGYLTPMTNIVFEEGGTLDKYIGDALMAFWGAPVAQGDHALRACRAALRFLDELERLRPVWRAEGVGEVAIGVGINTGPMVVGNMGSAVRFDYTVMGDAVNLASRLEGANKLFGTQVLLAEETYVQVQGAVCARRLGAVRVRGKHKPTRVYELRHLGAAAGEEAEAIRRFEVGVDAFSARRFEEAERDFEAVLRFWPADGPTRKYLDEVAFLRLSPPGPEWDATSAGGVK
jgi:adenylate cyclase